MRKMRWRMIALVAWLTLVWNIERLDVDRPAAINLASFTYVLLAATVGVLLFVPMRRRQMYVFTALVLVIDVLIKLSINKPLFWGLHKYVTVTELIVLLVTAQLAWLVSRTMRDFDQAVEAISLPGGRQRLPSFRKFDQQLRAVMGHARRHQRPLTVAMLEIDSATSEAALHQAVREAQQAMIARYVQVRFGTFLSRHIRETDVVAQYSENGRFMLIAPETSAADAAELFTRLGRLLDIEMGLRFRYAVADFPATALTAEELIREAQTRLATAPQEAPSVEITPEPRVEERELERELGGIEPLQAPN